MEQNIKALDTTIDKLVGELFYFMTLGIHKQAEKAAPANEHDY